MIPRQWFFFHSKLTSLSYLRYLSLATCRYHHPDWPIYVYDIKDDIDWGDDLNDVSFAIKDYTNEAKEVLGCQFLEWDPESELIKKMPPQNQSDLFSYAILRDKGGWYSDTDVLFVGGHENLLNYAFVGFGGIYYHVGMFGAKQGSWVMDSIISMATENYVEGEYNSTGTNSIIKNCATNEKWMAKFKDGDPTGDRNYHLPEWTWVSVFPEQHAIILSADFRIDSNAKAVHLYGSLATFHGLNKVMSPEYIMDGDNKDVISRKVREYASREKGIFLVK
jgi:hypothetical protein